MRPKLPPHGLPILPVRTHPRSHNVTLRSEVYSPECPLTLDLRQPMARAARAGAELALGQEAMSGIDLKLENLPPAKAAKYG